jgi:hypothetical protein
MDLGKAKAFCMLHAVLFFHVFFLICQWATHLCKTCFGIILGYLPDGTPMNKAGNAINHPETIQPDPHTPGSPLPRALFCNSVGYLPDGTPMNAAGNAMNHPETMQPDMHTPGSPLPPSHYYADVGYLVDGTDMATAGNLSVQARFAKLVLVDLSFEDSAYGVI